MLTVPIQNPDLVYKGEVVQVPNAKQFGLQDFEVVGVLSHIEHIWLELDQHDESSQMRGFVGLALGCQVVAVLESAPLEVQEVFVVLGVVFVGHKELGKLVLENVGVLGGSEVHVEQLLKGPFGVFRATKRPLVESLSLLVIIDKVLVVKSLFE